MTFENAVINANRMPQSGGASMTRSPAPRLIRSDEAGTLPEDAVLPISAIAERSLPLARLLSAEALAKADAGRGRIASKDAIRVRGYRSIERAQVAERGPSPQPSKSELRSSRPRKSGARECESRRH